MGRAKQIIVKVIPAQLANEFTKEHHYSGKVVQNSKLHFGCFLNGRLGGVMQYGSPIDKRNIINLVETDNKSTNEKWNEMLELNRMAFSDLLPRNSESRCIAISVKLMRKHAPQIKWLLSFSDGTQCGDGTIYRASGFKLTAINKNSTIFKLPSGETAAKHGTSKKDFTGAEKMAGFQLRYIYLVDKDAKLNTPSIPFAEIDKAGAGMYKGKNVSLQERKEQRE